MSVSSQWSNNTPYSLYNRLTHLRAFFSAGPQSAHQDYCWYYIRGQKQPSRVHLWNMHVLTYTVWISTVLIGALSRCNRGGNSNCWACWGFMGLIPLDICDRRLPVDNPIGIAIRPSPHSSNVTVRFPHRLSLEKHKGQSQQIWCIRK